MDQMWIDGRCLMETKAVLFGKFMRVSPWYRTGTVGEWTRDDDFLSQGF